jgi:predicted ATPase
VGITHSGMESGAGMAFVREVQLLRERVPDFSVYPFALPAIRNLHRLPLHPAVTFLVGENGSGKSTLLEAIAVAAGFNPEGGSRNFHFSTRVSHSPLHEYLRLVRDVRRPRDGFFLRAESLFNVATEIERLDAEPGSGPPIIDSYGGRSLHEQSHGESFFALLQTRLRGDGLYLLDEPEAALSPMRQMAALPLIQQLVQRGSQLVIATHSPILLAFPEAAILQLDETGVSRVEYVETEHYRITRDFLNRYPTALDRLLADGADSPTGRP